MTKKIVEKYARQGIEVTELNGKVFTAKIEFEPEVWVDILNKDGETLPACCANISAVRDQLFNAVRNGGFINIWDLAKVYRMLKDHYCLDRNDLEDDDPINYLMQLWEIVRDDCNEEHIPPTSDPNDPSQAISILIENCSHYKWSEIFSNKEYKSEVGKFVYLNRILPAISTVYHNLQQLGEQPKAAFAICEGDKVLEGSGGFLFCQKLDDANALLEDIKRFGKKESYQVRPVLVSLEKGVEFTD